MARKLEFDRDQVLQKAMWLFWEKGYESASMEELVKTMAINRFSIYNSFGDKKALFLEALTYYQHSIFAELLKPLQEDLPAIRCLLNYLDNLVLQLQKPMGKLGCFIQKTGQSFIVSDKQVAATLLAIFNELQTTLELVVIRAIAEGGLQGRYPPQQIVDFILTNSQGVILLRRTRQDNAFVNQQIALLKDTLQTW